MTRTLFGLGIALFGLAAFSNNLGCSDTDPSTDEELPLLTVEECEARGGTPHSDPGDGSTHRNGCPDSQEMIGNLKFGIEGGICCK